MNTFFNAPKTVSQAAYIVRIEERAARLQADGYRIQQMGRTPWYAIFKPGNNETSNARADYRVDLTPGKEACPCDGFARDKDCKHRIAAALKREDDKRWERMCAEHDAQEAREIFA